MTTLIDLPAELAHEIELRASREGRTVKDAIVDLVRMGLAASASPAEPAGAELTSSAVKTDPRTGLPYFECAPDAPISRMSSEEIYAMIHRTQEQEDLERIGITLRP